MKLLSIITATYLGIVQAKQYNATSKAVGKAIIDNRCNYNIYLKNTPSANGSHTEIDRILAPAGTYEQYFTPLTNGNGWSIKLSKAATFREILQFEYTWHPIQSPETIWWDISQVDGHPWNDSYTISAGGPGCDPQHRAYRYPKDNAHGMQSCPSDAAITLALCSDHRSSNRSLTSVSSRGIFSAQSHPSPQPSAYLQTYSPAVQSQRVSKPWSIIPTAPSPPPSQLSAYVQTHNSALQSQRIAKSWGYGPFPTLPTYSSLPSLATSDQKNEDPVVVVNVEVEINDPTSPQHIQHAN